MQSRSTQREEGSAMAEAWGGVRVGVVLDPRMSKVGLMPDRIRAAVPELYRLNQPTEAMKVYVAQLGMGPQSRGLHYDEVKTFASELHVPFVKDMDSVPLSGLVQEPNRLVWEHDGVCICGKRTYFLPRCARCFTEDKQEEVQIAAEQKQAEAEEQELKDAGPAAGGLRSGGTMALRGRLPCPYFRPGPYSQHLIVLCDSHLRGIMANPDI